MLPESIRACEDVGCNRDVSPLHRSETHGISEGAGRRVKKGTISVLVQPGPTDACWSDAIEFYGYLRDIHDSMADGQTPCQKRCSGSITNPCSKKIELIFISWGRKCSRASSLDMPCVRYLPFFGWPQPRAEPAKNTEVQNSQR